MGSAGLFDYTVRLHPTRIIHRMSRGMADATHAMCYPAEELVVSVDKSGDLDFLVDE